MFIMYYAYYNISGIMENQYQYHINININYASWRDRPITFLQRKGSGLVGSPKGWLDPSFDDFLKPFRTAKRLSKRAGANPASACQPPGGALCHGVPAHYRHPPGLVSDPQCLPTKPVFP